MVGYDRMVNFVNLVWYLSYFKGQIFFQCQTSCFIGKDPNSEGDCGTTAVPSCIFFESLEDDIFIYLLYSISSSISVPLKKLYLRNENNDEEEV